MRICFCDLFVICGRLGLELPPREQQHRFSTSRDQLAQCTE